MHTMFLLSVLFSCAGPVGEDTGDADGDGFLAPEDCDDGDASVHPDAEEIPYDGKDNDCWDVTPDDDLDGDGFGIDEDCDDSDGNAYPGNAEICDIVDNDCDGEIDNSELGVWFPDVDEDGYGDDSGQPSPQCRKGFVEVPGDCDDDDYEVHPGAIEVCDDSNTDNDCNGFADDDDPGVDPDTMVWFYEDNDYDGWGENLTGEYRCDSSGIFRAELDGDCDDDHSGVNPGETEVCDDEDTDEDCDGLIDDDDDSLDPNSQDWWYADGDGDGYGDDWSYLQSCEAAPGFDALIGGDCDDTDAGINPGALEVCDPADTDEDCDGYADDDDSSVSDDTTWYPDNDGDGYGDDDSPDTACDQPTGWLAFGGDCDDGDDAISPAAQEVCDALDVDEDCDGLSDDDDGSVLAATGSTWLLDSDGDGYAASAAASTVQCDATGSYTATTTGDCDDSDASVNPGATEVCDASDTDEDCNGLADDDDSGATGQIDYAPDSDGDGYGDSDTTITACDAPSGFVAETSDCDDDDADVYPDAWESCDDGLDNDCSGTADDCLIGVGGDLDGAWSTAWGESGSDYFGWSVSLADVNDDNIADVLIGAYGDDDGGSSAGAVYAFFGPITGDMDTSAPDLKIEGESSSDYVGSAIVGGSDINSDGYTDLVIGGYGYSSSAGATYLLHGPLTTDVEAGDYDARLLGESSSDYAGRVLSAAGDINDDNYADLLIGAYGADDGGSSSGVAYIVHGPLSGATSLSGADAMLIGESSSDYAGWAVFGGEDLDGDGTPDAMVGAYGDDDGGTTAGAGYVLYGPVSGDVDLSDADVKVTGASSSDYLGYALGAGDVNGDGYADGVFGAPFTDDVTTDGGATYVFFGPLTGDSSASSADIEIYGEDNDAGSGEVIEIGDLDGDGNADLILGVPEWTSSYDYGGVHIFYGPLSASASLDEADAFITTTAEDTEAGRSLSVDGDSDGDGYLDLLIGGPYDDTTSSDAGAAWLLLGGER